MAARRGAPAEPSFLTAQERLKLNQIRASSYAHLFRFVEEYIVANCVQHAHADIFGEEHGRRAMLRFAEEEVKRQLLFKRFQQLFSAGFGSPCACIPSQEAVAGVILSKSPMAVMTITLHIEVMTQQHYTHCIQNDAEMDPMCKDMLKAHWLEEAQHAKLDLQSLETAPDKTFTAEQRKTLLDSQARAWSNTFVIWGATNPIFVETVKQVFGADAELIRAKIAQLG